MYAVTQPRRGIIERLEPGAHQFNPIRVPVPKGVEHLRRRRDGSVRDQRRASMV